MNPNDSTRSDWYAPARTTPPAQQPPQPKKKKPHTGLKVVSLTLCVLLLLVASVYAFSDSFGLDLSWRRSDSEGSHRFTFEIPIPGGAENETPVETPETLPEEYDKDYRDFFSRYFTESSDDEREESSIRRVAPGATFRITLQSAAGRSELTPQELYASCADSIVGIRTSAGRMGYYWGSGVIMSEDGYILTNQHLISGTVEATVILTDGRELPALLVGEDSGTDLAVLKIEAEGLHAAVFGDSAALSVGDSVAAIGNPLTDSLSGTMTIGIISGGARSISDGSRPMTLLQHTAPINEGNSGGALFNMYGQVVGITNMKMSNRFSEVSVEGICFAVPSATAKTVTDQLFATGRYVRPGIGITVGAIDAETAAHYDLPDGLYVSAVSPNSDAAAKGVKTGDILTHVNGTPVHKSDDVLAIRDALQVGETLTLTLYRDGETFDLEIELFNLNDLY